MQDFPWILLNIWTTPKKDLAVFSVKLFSEEPLIDPGESLPLKVLEKTIQVFRHRLKIVSLTNQMNSDVI